MCLQSHHILWIWMAPLCHSSVKQDAQATKAFAIKTHYSLTNNTHSHKDKKKKNNHLKYTDLLPHNIHTQKQQHMSLSSMWQNLSKRVKCSDNKDKLYMFNKHKRGCIQPSLMRKPNYFTSWWFCMNLYGMICMQTLAITWQSQIL